MAIEDLQDALASYIGILGTSADRTHRAEDRSRYSQHLAAAAQMFAAMRRDPSCNELYRLLADEESSYGRSFLAGDEGSAAEAAFVAFASKARGRGTDS